MTCLGVTPKTLIRYGFLEIILQQTRVVQGYDYYCRFMEHFPDVETLAKASEDEVMKCWQGWVIIRVPVTCTKLRVRLPKRSFPVRGEDVGIERGGRLYGSQPFVPLTRYAVCGGRRKCVSRIVPVDGVEEPIDTGAGKTRRFAGR